MRCIPVLCCRCCVGFSRNDSRLLLLLKVEMWLWLVFTAVHYHHLCMRYKALINELARQEDADHFEGTLLHGCEADVSEFHRKALLTLYCTLTVAGR